MPWSGPGLFTGIFGRGQGAIWPSLSPCTVINPILLTYFGRGPGSIPTHGNQPLCHWHGGCRWCRTAHAHDIACGRSGERLCPVNDGGPVVAIFASLMALWAGRGEGGAPLTGALKPFSFWSVRPLWWTDEVPSGMPASPWMWLTLQGRISGWQTAAAAVLVSCWAWWQWQWWCRLGRCQSWYVKGVGGSTCRLAMGSTEGHAA